MALEDGVYAHVLQRARTHTSNRMTTRQQARQSMLRPGAGAEAKDLADSTTKSNRDPRRTWEEMRSVVG